MNGAHSSDDGTLMNLCAVVDKWKKPTQIRKIWKSILKRLLRTAPFTYKDSTRSLYRIWLVTNWQDSTFRQCVTAEYGYEYFEWLRNSTADTFLDIGANVGLFSLIASQNENIFTIYAFEPQPEVFEVLKSNIERNAARNVCAVQAAISSRNGYAILKVPAGHSGAATLRTEGLSFKRPVVDTKIQTIDHTQLSATVDSKKATRIAVKIDAEGHEEVVIRELLKTAFWNNVYNIFCEVDERWTARSAIEGILEREGFSQVKKIGVGKHYDLMFER